MGRNASERRAGWMDDTRAQGFEHRDWPLVQRLAAACVALLAIGLFVRIQLPQPGVAVLCYIIGGAFGGAMLPYFFDKRLFVERPPKQ